jgi:hypothetical protein
VNFGGALRNAAVTGFSAVTLVMLAASAHATNLVSNGTFSAFSNGTGGGNSAPSPPTGYAGQFDSTTYTTLTNWTSASGGSGYNFLFTTGSSSDGNTSGSTNYTSYGVSGLVTLDNKTVLSPAGGNFIGLDGDYHTTAVTQTISGLTVGATYTLGFYWAASQQTGYTAGTTDSITATLGSTSHTTASVANPTEGFTGWTYQTFGYTATSVSETLTFLAAGTPTGLPPFLLISDVSLTAPEPGTLSLMLGGLGLLAGAGFLRSKQRPKK